MREQLTNAGRGVVLAAATFFPQLSAGQDSKAEKPAVAPGAAAGEAPSISAATLGARSPDVKKLAELPPRIVELAASRGVNPAEVKLESGTWVACLGDQCIILAKALPEEVAARRERVVIGGLRQGEELIITEHPIRTHKVEAPDYGIPGLGWFTKRADGIEFKADENFAGTVRRASGQPQSAKPVAESGILVHQPYSTGYLREIKQALADPELTVVLVASVPEQCGPCRDFRKDLESIGAGYHKGDKLRIFVVDFTSFDEPRAVMGPLLQFPAITLFPPRAGSSAGGAVNREESSVALPFIPNAGRAYNQQFGKPPLAQFREKLKGLVSGIGRTVERVGDALLGR